MLRSIAGTFLVLHGLVHVWYVVLAQKVVAFQPQMGWTGESWAFSNLMSDNRVRLLASILYSIAAAAFVVSGAGLIAGAHWSRWALLASAVFSTIVILLFWDGKSGLFVQKGLIAVLINIAVIVLVLVLRPSST